MELVMEIKVNFFYDMRANTNYFLCIAFTVS
jgi:hypothetical protein